MKALNKQTAPKLSARNVSFNSVKETSYVHLSTGLFIT